MLRIAYALSILTLLGASAVTGKQIEDRNGRLSADAGIILVALSR